MVKRLRLRALVIAVGALGATVRSLAVVADAPARVSNSCGPCPLVATIKDGSRTVLLQGAATSRPVRRSQNLPFQASDRLTWRLTFHDLNAPVARATIRLGPPTGHGRYLFTLCGPCASGVHGDVPLGNALARVVTAGVVPTCKMVEAGQPRPRGCPPAKAWPMGASLHVLLADQAGTRVAGQLRFCGPHQYRHRNSCSPPGY
jgi:hypothetical protein